MRSWVSNFKADYAGVLPLLVILWIASFSLGQVTPPPNKIKLPSPPKLVLLSAKAIADKALPSVVLILSENGTEASLGSGFFIAEGIVVTNYHVIRGMRRGIVQVGIGKTNVKKNFRVARILDFDEESDLAILAVSIGTNVSIPGLFLGGTELPVIGESIYALGNPEGLVGTISPGIISASLRSRDKKARLQITAPISSGSSGGPVVNERGEVVAVVASSLTQGQNLNFAIPVSLVRELVERTRLPDIEEALSDLTAEMGSGTPRDWVWQRREACTETKTRYSAKEAETLKGLRGIEVLVEDLNETTSRFVSESVLKGSIASTLQKSGIRVVSSSSFEPGSPALYINISCVAPNSYGTSCSYRVELLQSMRSEVDKELVSFGVRTWGKAGTLTGPNSSIADQLRQVVDRMTLQFAIEFVNANK